MDYKKRSVMFWLLCGYLFLFIERPWEIWPIFEGLRIERVYMLFVLTVFLFWPGKKWVWHNTSTWIVGFLAMHYILAPFAYNPGYATEQGFEYFKMVVFYFLIVMTIRDEAELRDFILAFVIILGLYLTHSFREFLAGRHVYRMGIVRMIGVDQTFNDPNTFAATIVFSFPFVMALFNSETKKFFKLGYLAYFMLGLTCLVLTGSRSGFVTFLLLVILYVLSKKGWKKIIYISLAFIFLGFTWIIIPADKKERFITIVDPSVGPENAQESAEGRIEGLKSGWRMFKENPFTGVGAGGDNFLGYRVEYDDGIEMQPHNLIGQLLAGMGIMGVFFFLGILASTIHNSLKIIMINKYYDSKKIFFELGRAILITIILLLFSGLFGHNLYRPIWLWLAAWSSLIYEFSKKIIQATNFYENDRS